MPRLNKVIKSCKKARLAKLSKPYTSLISIDTNSTTNPITTPLDTNSAIILINMNPNIIYKDGSHKGEILSSYLQKKAMEWILANREKLNINLQEKDQEIRLLKVENSQLKQK